MNWLPLTDTAQLDGIDRLSADRPVLIFKHSTRCSISMTALSRLERVEGAERLEPAFHLDLLSHRDISNAIEERYGITHESPQVLVIRNGECMFHASHLGIVAADLLAAMERVQ